ncbi:hypothetical protein [Priestia megaterium]|uniref:hypothetical protein n=1 Tax=Priestia megaterium TaxID=1404 RepID=UPI0027955C3E|nr:hypothetical protein [Priestia megaterium]
MEIKVRNVCPFAVSKVDCLAKEKGLSRQAFLKEQIETLSIFDTYVLIDTLRLFDQQPSKPCSLLLRLLKAIVSF